MRYHRPVTLRSIRRLLPALAAVAIAAALAGCAQSPRMDRQFGSAMRLAQAQQTINPNAKFNRDPVNGLDAQAAKSAYDNYQRSYSTQDQQSNFTIGVGSR